MSHKLTTSQKIQVLTLAIDSLKAQDGGGAMGVIPNHAVSAAKKFEAYVLDNSLPDQSTYTQPNE